MLKGDFSVPITPEDEELLEKVIAALAPYLGKLKISTTTKRGVDYKLVYLDLVEPEHAITKRILKK